jgi:predicted DCC family thiol-disulfide oxidoreductase YuxK
MDQDETGKLRFCSLQSKVAKSLLLRQGKSPKEFSTIAMITDQTAYYSSDAVSRICMELDAVPLQLFGQLGQITPDFVREAIFQVVSKNRYQFGEYDSCRIDYDGTLVTRFVADPEDQKPASTEESSSSSSS